MADPVHLNTLRQGVDAWNAWREENPDITPDLSGADLTGAELFEANLSGAELFEANLSGANLSEANLSEANLSGAILIDANLSRAIFFEADLDGACLLGANLIEANLSEANLSEADLVLANLSGAVLKAQLSEADLSLANLTGAIFFEADLTKADLSGATLARADLTGACLLEANLTKAILFKADLSGAILIDANLFRADLSEANLSGATFERASLVETDLSGADLTGCRIYGMSAWDLNLEGAKQNNLIITQEGQPEITVDNMEVAQFIYLLLHNEKIRDIIDTITSKAVLILGRFTPERKAVLDALRDELRKRDYLPVLFDFDKPTSRTTDETVTLLARMARFVIADISDAKSVLQELRGIVPELSSVPIQPVIIASQEEPGMFDFFRRFPWFLPVHRYDTPAQLLSELSDRVIKPSEAKVLEFRSDH